MPRKPTALLATRVMTTVDLVALAIVLSLSAAGCGPGFASAERGIYLPAPPTDVTATLDGDLFVSSRSTGALFRIAAGVVERIPFDGYRPYGLATLADGRVCVAHDTSDDPLTRQSAVSCWRDRAWLREATGIGSGLNGLLASSQGLWAVGWRDTDVEQRDGLLTLLADGSVTRQLTVPEHYLQFAAELPSGDLLVSAWREDASGFTGGGLLRVSVEGGVAVFSEALERPGGLVVAEEGVWATDHAAGELVLLSLTGAVLARHAGLGGPLGLDLIDAGTLCVAESQAARITCLQRADIIGGSR